MFFSHCRAPSTNMTVFLDRFYYIYIIYIYIYIYINQSTVIHAYAVFVEFK